MGVGAGYGGLVGIFGGLIWGGWEGLEAVGSGGYELVVKRLGG